LIRTEIAISAADFTVGDERTVYEWCMIYSDRHPGVATLHATTAHQKDRLLHLGAIATLLAGPFIAVTPARHFEVDTTAHYRISNAVYQELATAIQTGSLEPKRRAYLEDGPGQLDPTLCVLEATPILAIAERRGDGGEVIQKLLAERRQPAATVEPAEQATAERKLVKKSRGRGGRRVNSGARDDAAPIAKMLQLLASEKATSVWDAATKVAKSMQGHALEANTRRIYRKFRERYGTDPPPGKIWSDIEHELNSI
jgi:hypothetical protein